jgi:hypothetical protein
MVKMVKIIPTALLLSLVVPAQETDTPYRNMASIDQYLIADRNAEIALAKSAVPTSIADNAEVMVLERQGYKTAVKGANGFVCIVERSWTAGFGDRVLESQDPSADLLQSTGRANIAPHHHRKNPAGPGGEIGNSDARRDQLRSRQEGTA